MGEGCKMASNGSGNCLYTKLEATFLVLNLFLSRCSSVGRNTHELYECSVPVFTVLWQFGLKQVTNVTLTWIRRQRS